jgi:hypothetical protein
MRWSALVVLVGLSGCGILSGLDSLSIDAGDDAADDAATDAVTDGNGDGSATDGGLSEGGPVGDGFSDVGPSTCPFSGPTNTCGNGMTTMTCSIPPNLCCLELVNATCEPSCGNNAAGFACRDLADCASNLGTHCCLVHATITSGCPLTAAVTSGTDSYCTSEECIKVDSGVGALCASNADCGGGALQCKSLDVHFQTVGAWNLGICTM